ncbi:YdcH family protein [Pseudomonas sp. X10]
MPVTHDLLADLHITADDFEKLKETHNDLTRLHKDYLAVDKETVAAENNGTADDEVNRLRKERLLIKDKIERIVHPPQS